jgi:hypothetical protein
VWDVCSIIQLSHQLCNGKDNRRFSKGDLLEPFLNLRGPWLCGWPCAAISHTLIHSREDRQVVNIRKTGGSTYKYQEDGNNDS